MQSDRGSGEKLAFVDTKKVTDLTGQCYPGTVVRCDCDILFLENAARCASCDCFRSTLRTAVSRYNKRDSENRTQADSHTAIRPQMRNLH